MLFLFVTLLYTMNVKISFLNKIWRCVDGWMNGWNQNIFFVWREKRKGVFSTMYPYEHRADISENDDFQGSSIHMAVIYNTISTLQCPLVSFFSRRDARWLLRKDFNACQYQRLAWHTKHISAPSNKRSRTIYYHLLRGFVQDYVPSTTAQESITDNVPRLRARTRQDLS